MPALVIREIEERDFADIAAGEASVGRQMTADEARDRCRGWERRRSGRTRAVVGESGVLVGTASVSPSRHIEGAASVGARVWDEGYAEEAYRLALDAAREEGYAAATCTLAAGDDSERAIWERLGARFEETGDGRSYLVLRFEDSGC